MPSVIEPGGVLSHHSITSSAAREQRRRNFNAERHRIRSRIFAAASRSIDFSS
jgi:hypothetical protein